MRGGPPESTTGFYLTGMTGRVLAAKRLAQWISGPASRGLAVVTGSPGTGKSALLAMPVLLTDESRRHDLLRAAQPGSLIQQAAAILAPETPVVAVHARGLNTDQVAGAIASGLGKHVASRTRAWECRGARGRVGCSRRCQAHRVTCTVPNRVASNLWQVQLALHDVSLADRWLRSGPGRRCRRRRGRAEPHPRATPPGSGCQREALPPSTVPVPAR